MRNPEPVEVEGRTIFVHPLTAGQYRRLVAFMRSAEADPVTGDFMLLSWSCKDADGKLVYPTAADAEGMSVDTCNALLPVCVKVNGFGGEDQKKNELRSNPVALTLYRLSLAWGQPVTQLEQTLSAEDLIGYGVYYELEPWGSEADDLRFQQLCYTVAQSQSTKRLKPADFAMPWRRVEKKTVNFEAGLTAFVAHAQQLKKIRERQP